MSTVSKLKPLNGYYGTTTGAAYKTKGVHLYVGHKTGSGTFRTLLSFSPISSIKEIGSSYVRIKSITLYVYRNDGGATTNRQITVGCSSNSAWDATTDAYVSPSVTATTGWKAITLTDFGDKVVGYSSTWYLHLSGATNTNNYYRFDSPTNSNPPYVEIEWEYAASTITGNQPTATLGSTSVTYTITPETNDERYTLQYTFYGASGIIATKSAGTTSGSNKTFTWTPPLSLAMEIPNSISDIVNIRMTVYVNDVIQRTESYYQTVTIPSTVMPNISDQGISMLSAFNGNMLANRSYLCIAPTINMSDAYGATIMSLMVDIGNTWSSNTCGDIEEYDDST